MTLTTNYRPLLDNRPFFIETKSAAREYPVGSGCVLMTGNFGVAGRRVDRPEAEQRLEGGHRGAAAVVAKDELVEVDLQVLGRGAPVGALKPGLEVGERAVSA